MFPTIEPRELREKKLRLTQSEKLKSFIFFKHSWIKEKTSLGHLLTWQQAKVWALGNLVNLNGLLKSCLEEAKQIKIDNEHGEGSRDTNI